MFRKTLILGGLTAVMLFALAVPADAWDARAGCNVVRLDAGRNILGWTTLVYLDGTHQKLDIQSSRFNVNNQSDHGHIMRVRFSNGESVDLAEPIGCTTTTTAPETTTTPTTVAAPVVTAAPDTTTVPVVTPTTVVAEAELPRTGSTSFMLVGFGIAALAVGTLGLCFVGNRSRG